MQSEDLKTVLVNLLGNAVKYNRDGGEIKVRATASGAWVRVDVQDLGLGMKAESLPHVFDEFFREKRQETREIEGNGLGLAIVRRLVERAGGRVEVSSVRHSVGEKSGIVVSASDSGRSRRRPTRNHARGNHPSRDGGYRERERAGGRCCGRGRRRLLICTRRVLLRRRIGGLLRVVPVRVRRRGLWLLGRGLLPGARGDDGD
jgi:signal transduction histidine kinase